MLRAGTECVGVRATIGAQVLTCRLIVGALSVGKVFETESDLSPDGQLFGTQFPANLEFHSDSHPRLRGLGGSNVINSLLDHVFVYLLGIERLFKSEICLTQSAVCYLALVFVLGKDYADPLALFGREAKLLDRVRIRLGHFLRITRRREEENQRQQDHHCSQIFLKHLFIPD